MMEHYRAIKITFRIIANGLTVIYNIIDMEKSDRKAIYPI